MLQISHTVCTHTQTHTTLLNEYLDGMNTKTWSLKALLETDQHTICILFPSSENVFLKLSTLLHKDPNHDMDNDMYWKEKETVLCSYT